MRLQHRVGLGGERRILDPGLWKPFGDSPVESQVGRGVDGRIAVEGLQIDGVHRPGPGQLADELVVPLRRRVELEAESWVELEPAEKRRGRGVVSERGRDDEPHRPGLAPDRLGERAARLAQRKVKGRALVGPAAMRLRYLERRGERLQRPRAVERKHGAGSLVLVVCLRVPGDVLTDTLVPAAVQVGDRRHATEPARHRLLEPLELVPLDCERQPGKLRVGAD